MKQKDSETLQQIHPELRAKKRRHKEGEKRYLKTLTQKICKIWYTHREERKREIETEIPGSEYLQINILSPPSGTMTILPPPPPTQAHTLWLC